MVRPSNRHTDTDSYRGRTNEDPDGKKMNKDGG